MGTLGSFVFLLFLTVAHAFLEPHYEYQRLTYGKKGPLQQNSTLEGMPKGRRLIPLFLADKFDAKQGKAGTKKAAPPNSTDFKSLRTPNALLIDKTNFIADFLEEEYTHVMITRPRGFGKSFVHSMLYQFFNINNNSTELFEGTFIAKKRKICQAYRNKYPVIRVSFGELENAKTWDEAVGLFKNVFSKMVDDHFHPNSEKSQETVSKSLETRASLMTIEKLSEHLYNHFKKEAIVLIDDFDTPLHAAYYNGYYPKMVDFLRSLYLSAFEGNCFLKKSLILGVSQVGREEIFSEVKHMTSWSVMDSRYSSYFGFTKNETVQLIGDYKLDAGLIEKMVRKYGGFNIGIHSLLNPYSVTQSLKNDGSLMNYWMDSEKGFIKHMNSSGVIPLFESEVLMMNLSIYRIYDERTSYSDLKQNMDTLWTLAIDFGYVTFTKKMYIMHGKFNSTLLIPNKEVYSGFHEYVDEYHAQHKNLLPYKECRRLILSQDSLGGIDCLDSYFNSTAHYFVAENVHDPFGQTEKFIKTVFEGLREHYDRVDFMRGHTHKILRAELVGRRSGLPLGIMAGYHDDMEDKAIYVYRLAKLMSVYRNIFTHVKFGAALINDKLLWYVIESGKGYMLGWFFDCIDRWIGRPVEDFDTKIRNCLNNFWKSKMG